MSDEQINIAIAEHCGWTEIEQYTQAVDGWYGYEPENGTHSQVPNYCKDLNAMHEAEKIILNDLKTWRQYVDLIRVQSAKSVNPIFHLTARQRAEAFLKTIGKWEEAK
jgi:hypothetical protein